MSKLKGYIFRQRSHVSYFGRFCQGNVVSKAEAHVYTVAEAKKCYLDHCKIQDGWCCKSDWGHTDRGTWIAVWEKS